MQKAQVTERQRATDQSVTRHWSKFIEAHENQFASQKHLIIVELGGEVLFLDQLVVDAFLRNQLGVGACNERSIEVGPKP